MAAVVGFAFLVTVVTPCGKRVFLLVVTTIPNAMRRMATTAATVKKSGRRPFKKSAVGGKKTAARALLPALHITRTAARAARGLLYGRGNAHGGRVNQQKTPRGCFLSVFCPFYY